MSLSSKSREIIRMEDSQRVTKLGRECREDVERIRQTMQRGGGVEKAVDARHVRFMSEALDGLGQSYLDAYAREGQCPTMHEIDAITDEMRDRVRSNWQARVELEPKSVGIGFRESLEQIIPVQRQKLVLAMKRIERERELATPQTQEPSSSESMDKKQLDREQRELLISLVEASHRGAGRRPTFHYTQPPPDGPPRVTHPGLRGELIVAVGDIERFQQLACSSIVSSSQAREILS
jgi:hypothetical protein